MRAVTATAAALVVVALASPARADSTTPPQDVDLAAGPANATVQVRYGEVPQLSFEVRNNGTTPLPGVVLALRTFDRYYMPTHHDNCWGGSASQGHGDIDTYLTVCEFAGVIAPGTSYHLAEVPFPKVEYPGQPVSLRYEHTWYTLDDAERLRLKVGRYQGSGPALRLAPEPAPATPGGSFTDSNMTNNTAKGTIVVDYSSPSPSPSTSPSVSATSSTSASASAAPSPAGTEPGGTGGGLAVTGANATVLGAAGAALLAVGLALFLVARRRRNSFTA